MGNSWHREETDSLEPLSLIWLDALVNQSNENLLAQERLRQVIPHLRTFEDAQTCLEYIQSTSENDRIVLIVSGNLGRLVVPRISPLRQIISIYIFCGHKIPNEHWSRPYPKVKGVVVRLFELIECIQNDQTKRHDQRLDEAQSICIFNSNMSNDGHSSTNLDAEFLHFQRLIRCLIQMKPEPNEKDQFISMLNHHYRNNPVQLKKIRELGRDYRSDQALQWYTRSALLYNLLNKALRVQNIHLLYSLRFIIRDIYNQLKQRQCQTPVRVYRCQLMSKDEINLLRNHLHDLISINSFFSTSHSQQVSLLYSGKSESIYSNNLQRVFFEIDAHPQMANLKPFADIKLDSHFPDEEEVLFMAGSIFRLDHIRYNHNGIWNIHLTLCSDDDHQLRSLLKYMNEDLGRQETTLLHLGHVLKDMGKLDTARTYYSYYLQQIPGYHPMSSSCYHALGTIANAKGDLHTALEFYRIAFRIAQQTLPPSHENIATICNSLGEIYRQKREYNRSLGAFHKALDIFEENFGYYHPHVATCLNNIGIVCKNKKNDSEALEWYEAAAKIREMTLPHHHPHLGQSYNNIGTAYRCLGKCDLALHYLHRSLRIKSQSLPSQHTNIASTLANIGIIHEEKRRFSQAHDYYQRALAIYQHSLPPAHPHVIKVQNMIRRVNSKHMR